MAAFEDADLELGEARALQDLRGAGQSRQRQLYASMRWLTEPVNHSSPPFYGSMATRWRLRQLGQRVDMGVRRLP